MEVSVNEVKKKLKILEKEIQNILNDRNIAFDDYDQKEITNEEERLKDKFSNIVDENNKGKLKFTCPECGESFEVRVVEVLREINKLGKT